MQAKLEYDPSSIRLDSPDGVPGRTILLIAFSLCQKSNDFSIARRRPDLRPPVRLDSFPACMNREDKNLNFGAASWIYLVASSPFRHPVAASLR